MIIVVDMDLTHRQQEDLIREIHALREELARVRSSSPNTQPSLPVTNGEKVSFTHLQRSLKNAALLAVSTDERGCITFCNSPLAQLIGEPEDTLLGRKLFEEIMPLQGDKFDIDRFLHATINQKIAEHSQQTLKTRSGKTIDISIVSTILHQEGEQYHGLTIIAEDHSERESVRRKLAESNKLLDELYNSALDLIQICDEQGKLVFVNRAWCEKMAYSAQEAESLHFRDVVHPQYRNVAQSYWERLDEPGGGEKFRSVFAAKSGELVHVSGSIISRTDEQGRKTYRGVFHDVSDQVRAERSRNLYNSIASHTIHSSNLQDLFHNIYRELKKAVRAEDFSIAIQQQHTVDFSYWAGPQAYLLEDPTHRAGLEDLVDYAMAVGKPLLLDETDLTELVSAQVIRPLSVLPKVWIGIPLISKQQTVGLLSVQNQKHEDTLSSRDLELLDFVSGQVALAIDRKANEEKLNEQQSRQYAIFESSTHLVWSVDRDLKFTAFNRNFEKTLEAQYRVAPRLGEQYHAGYPEVSRTYLDFWEERYREAFRGKIVQFEAPFSYGNDIEVWKLVFINPIYREDGTIREVSGIAHDSTQRKKSEMALLESEEKFRNIYESFQDIYFRCRLDGTLTMISPSVQELTHYETYDVLGRNITNYYLYDKRTKNLIRRLVEQKRVRNFEATIIRADGELIQCICNVRLVENFYGKTREIEGVARDITKLKKTNIALQKAKDEAERSLRIKEAFLANMSHEIRTPMNGIVNMIHLLADTPLNEKQQEYINTVQDSSETLLAILNDILDLSKIEAGKMKLQLGPASLPEIIKKLYRLFSHQATAKNVSLRYHIHEPIPEVLLLDEVRLLQVLSNLTANAIKFTEPEGLVLIQVEDADSRYENSSESVEKEHTIKVTVKDTGIGIAPKDQKSLFKNFSQVDASISKRYQGTGLGLSIARQLVELMGGKIGVDSRIGQGSTFWFTFRATATNAVLPTTTEGQRLTFAGPGPLVLVVDDNAINRRVAREILERSGCQVTTADRGEAAIARVQQQPFDIILMDIQMPNMNGVEATERIRALNLPQLPPIVAMTAYSMQGDKDKFMEAGLDEYISKPIRPDEMLSKVALLSGYALKNESTTPEATVSDSNTLEIISDRVLEKLKKYGGNELVVESLQDFEVEAESLLDAISAAMQDVDYLEILHTLHTLKGNASTLGIERMAHWAKTIESNLKQKKYDGLSEDLLILSASFLEFQHTFHQTYKPKYHV